MQTCQSCATPQKQRIMGQGMHRIHYGLSQNVFFVLFIVYSFDPGWFFVFNSSDKKKTMPELCSFCHACVDCVVLCVSGPCFSVRVSFSSCLNHSDTAFHLHCREAAQCAVNSNKALSSCSLASWVLEVFILALTRGLWYGSTSLSCSMWTTECVNEYTVTIRWNTMKSRVIITDTTQCFSTFWKKKKVLKVLLIWNFLWNMITELFPGLRKTALQLQARDDRAQGGRLINHIYNQEMQI